MERDALDRRLMIGALSGAVGVVALSRVARGGPLDPPAGPVTSTGKTLTEIHDRIAKTSVGTAEPRISVQSLPGSATALHVINHSGSYYMTGNIQGVTGKSAIEIVADRVTINLCGHSPSGISNFTHAIVATGVWRGICVRGSVPIVVESASGSMNRSCDADP